MGQNGRKAVEEKFNWSKEEKKLIEAYERIIKKNSFMKEYQGKFKAYFEKAEIRHAWVDGILWREYQRMIMPAGPITESHNLTSKGTKQLFKTFTSAVLCRWSTPSSDENENPDFYAVVCKSHTSIGVLRSKRRNEINRGLANCRVEIVNPREIAEAAYEIYRKAVESYGQTPIAQKIFSKEFFLHKGFKDIIHYWGVFFQEKLIAYAKILLYGKEEANVSSAKFDPEYRNLYPSYALFYKINEYYLLNQNFKFVNDGFRSIKHDTNIQNFLIQKFGYEKHPLIIHLKFKSPWGFLFIIARPFRFILKKIWPNFEALCELSQIARKQKPYL